MRRRSNILKPAIDVSPMPNADDQDHQPVMLDRVDNAVISDAHPIERFPALELLGPRRKGMVRQGNDVHVNAMQDILRELAKIAMGRSGDLNTIAHFFFFRPSC